LWFVELNGCDVREWPGRNGHALCARASGKSWSLRSSLVAANEEVNVTGDDRLASFLSWARSFRFPHSPAVQSPPLLLPRDAVELLGTLLQVLYKNAMVKLFVGLHPLPDAAPAALRALNKQPRMLAALNRLLVLAFKDAKSARRGRMAEVWSALPTPFHPAGVVLPDDLRWAAPNAHVADALRFMHVEQERVRTTLIPSCVSDAFVGWLNAWAGAVPDARVDWAAAVETEAVQAAGPDAVFLARFVVVAGVAGEQMPAGGLDEFRARWAGHDPELALKSVCSWASWMTARRIVAWMAAPLAAEPTAAAGLNRTGAELSAPLSLSAAHGMGGHVFDADELL